MDKVIKSNSQIQSFGGINFIEKKLMEENFFHFIDNELGNRAPQAMYSYSDMIKTLSYSIYCGAEYLSDLDYLKPEFLKHKTINFCSPDTVEYVVNELKTEKTIYNNNGIKHEFNINSHLNKLLVKTPKKLRLFKRNKEYTLDYDNVITENEKYDSKRTYTKVNGYQCGVAYIEKLPVYVEGRNGNSNAKYKMAETLERCFNNLKNEKIKVSKFRSDCAAYQEDVIDIVRENCEHFYIRLQNCQELWAQIRRIEKWEKIELNNHFYEFASILYACFSGRFLSRAVIMREKKEKDNQLNLFTGDSYTYRAIITDDYKMSDIEIVNFYNQRGAIEKNFDILNHCCPIN